MIRMQNGMLVPDSPVNRMARMAGGAFGIDEGGGPTPPPTPTPTDGPMYFEAVQANSTVFLMSTLPTAPNLEYSTDGVTWQEWEYTDQTMNGVAMHNFDTLTLTAVGDRVYLRGDNPNGFARSGGPLGLYASKFGMTGQISAGGNIMSLIDKTLSTTIVPDYGLADLFEGTIGTTILLNTPSMATITEIGNYGCIAIFGGCTSLTAAADMPMLTKIGEYSLQASYGGCTSLTAAADMPLLELIGKGGCHFMYTECTFDMSDDGTTLNFDFPTPPITTTGDNPETYATTYDVAAWMGNTNGFVTP